MQLEDELFYKGFSLLILDLASKFFHFFKVYINVTEFVLCWVEKG